MKNVFIPLVCFSVFLVACGTSQKSTHAISSDFSKNSSGDEHCYKGFVSEMSRLIPAKAYYCGIFGNSNGSSSVQCAKKALSSGKPFIVGYQSFGYDSKYCRAVAKQADGQLLSIFFDGGMIGSGDNAAFFEISRCKKIKLKPDKRGNPYFEADECTVAKDLADQVIQSRNN